MYTDKEVREILDRVYSEAYDAGIDDTLEYFEENYEFDSDDSFDLEDDYNYYNESKNVRKQMDKLGHYVDVNGTKEYYSKYRDRDWTKFSDNRVYSKKTGEPNAVSWKGTYRVHNNDNEENPRSEARGRIKSGNNKSDDPRSKQLKEKVKANADRREAEKKERLRPFKNKGNQY